MVIQQNLININREKKKRDLKNFESETDGREKGERRRRRRRREKREIGKEIERN
jgi:hypothetical protein